MKTILLSAMIILLSSFTSCSKDKDSTTPDVRIGQVGDEFLTDNAQIILDDYEIPALGAMSMKSGEILERIELGVQSFSNNKEILNDSKWHVGSITKSMTATLVGILVEKGHLTWSTKIGDLTTEGYLEEYQDVTLYELLSMTAGITPEEYPVDTEDMRPVSEIRQEWAIEALNLKRGNPGDFVYSNTSYVIAGTLLELIMESTWEDLITTYLFSPLAMTNTGFGAPGNLGESDQPWGHRRRGNDWDAKDPTSVFSDNPLALGPAGIVHTTLSDMAKYANLHLGKTNILTTETLDILHGEVNDSGYALGWFVSENGIFHSGSNANWFAQLFINVDQEFVNFGVTNSYDSELKISAPAVQTMMGVLGQRYENSL